MRVYRSWVQILLLIFSVVIVISFSESFTYAHSGRTDAQGGHKDNKNASGLGSYHYHHGYGPHLHENGICPFESSSSTSKEVVKKEVTTVSSVKFLSQFAFLEKGQSEKISVSINPYNAVDKTLIWDSDNEEVIQVTDGVLKAVGVGKAEITAFSKNWKSDKIQIEVLPEVQSLTILEPEKVIKVNKPFKLEVKSIPEDLPQESFEWFSNDSKIIRIDDNGIIVPISPGIAKVSCKTPNDTNDVITVEVFQTIDSLEINQEIYTLNVDEISNVDISLIPKNANKEFITWKVTNPKIALINENFEVQAISNGRTSVYAIINGVVQDAFAIEVVKENREYETIHEDYVGEIGTDVVKSKGEKESGTKGYGIALSIFVFAFLGIRRYIKIK